jgi:hypothetical protein
MIIAKDYIRIINKLGQSGNVKDSSAGVGCGGSKTPPYRTL